MTESSRSRSNRPLEKLTTANPVDSTSFSEVLHSIVLKADKDGDLVALPVILVDPTNNPMKIPGTAICKSAAFTIGAASASLWTPTNGKRFNIIAYAIDVSSSCAEAALDDGGIQVADGGVTKFIHACTVPAISVATVTGGKSIAVYIGGGGYSSVAQNNVLTFNVGGNLTGGRISMVVWGYESL